MVGLLAVGFVANLLIRPVDERFHEPDDRDDATEPATSPRGATHDRASRGRPGPLVGVPLVYGLVETINKAATLFTK